MLFGKRGQADAANAATLIGLVAAMIILYILFLPPEDRSDLLGNDDDDDSGDDDDLEETVVLLREFPGRLDPEQDPEDHLVPTVHLIETTNAKELADSSAFQIRNGWFDKKAYTFTFEIDDFTNTDNLLLSFSAQGQGVLSIVLNNHLIYEQEPGLNPDPISLNKDLLGTDNTLVFSVASVGWMFWSTNEYMISGLRVVGDITDKSRQRSQNVFTIKEFEYLNLDRAVLKFLPSCRQGEVGVLDVMLNRRIVFSSVPDCNMINRQDLPLQSIEPGENTLVFTTEQGSYILDHIEIETELKEYKSTLYYFEMNQTHADALDAGTREAEIYFDFVDDDETKKAVFSINGHTRSIDQRDSTYTSVLPDYWLEEGNNYLKITPRSVVNIVTVEVRLNED